MKKLDLAKLQKQMAAINAQLPRTPTYYRVSVEIGMAGSGAWWQRTYQVRATNAAEAKDVLTKRLATKRRLLVTGYPEVPRGAQFDLLDDVQELRASTAPARKASQHARATVQPKRPAPAQVELF